MNKKMIALAVASAVSVPAAMAQSSNPVTLYGLLDVTVENVKASGGYGPVASRTRVANQTSRLGVRGTEDLGGGLRAWFQLESQVNPDDACGAGGNPSTGTTPNGGCSISGNGGKGLASRNSAVGLEGDFGSLLIGRWDTPYKVSSIGVDPTSNVTIGAYTTVMHDSGNFDRRENNAIQYWTPNMNGFQAKFHYSANEAKTSSANPYTYAASLMYASGPFSLGYAFERHSNQAGSTPTGGVKETGNELSALLTVGTFKFGGMIERIKKTGFTTKKAYMLSVQTTSGAWNPYLSYGYAKDGGATTGASGKALTLGANYWLSKRSNLYALYTGIRNNSAASYNFGMNPLGGVGADSDPRGFGVGVKHVF